MLTVSEVSRLTGVSVRALHYYDRMGLLPPAQVTGAGYRLYDDGSLERLGQILLFRELEFPLKEIGRILASPDFDREQALRQQAELLTMKKERLERLIEMTNKMRTGVTEMSFSAFDTKKIDEYAAAARERWGDTAAYREYEEKRAGAAPGAEADAAAGLMALFADLGRLRGLAPESEAAQAAVAALREYITAHYYSCTPEILGGLGEMYSAGGEMTENIDRAGGAGTAELATKAIRAYCARLR